MNYTGELSSHPIIVNRGRRPGKLRITRVNDAI